MAVVLLLTLLMTFVKAQNLPVIEMYKSCHKPARNILTSDNSTIPTSSQLPTWCLAMRHDVASCIAKKLSLDNNGSISSRGSVLLYSYQQSGDDKILADVKLYHYGCLYNSWQYFSDEKCYNKMVEQCVIGDDSCYYKPCHTTTTHKSVAKISWKSSRYSNVSPAQQSVLSVLMFLTHLMKYSPPF